MALIFKPTTPACMSMRPYANNLANSLHRKRGVKTRVMFGFLMRAEGDGKNVVVTVLEPAGFIGGVHGNLERAVGYYYPGTQGRVTAMYRAAIPPVSTLVGGEEADPTFAAFNPYNASGGLTIGDAPTWSSKHNLLPSSRACAAVVPSAVLFPCVTGSVSTVYTGSVPDAPANRSVLVQRLNAVTAWRLNNEPEQTAPATPYGLWLNRENYEKSKREGIGYVEIAAGELGLIDAELTYGSNAALEWGALEGVVVFDAATPYVKTIDSDSYTEGEPADSPTGIYPVGHVLAAGTPGVRGARTPGRDKEPLLRCARYSINLEVEEDAQGTPTYTYTPSLLWVRTLDGNGAPDGLSADAAPAMTAPPGPIYGDVESGPTAWSNLWRLQDVLLWAPSAGKAGDHAREGEFILGIGTAIVRRFKPTIRRTITFGLRVAQDPYLPREMTVGTAPALRTYQDRHLVRFKINTTTGAIQYESLYQFVNCFDTLPNDISGFIGVQSEYSSLPNFGSGQLEAYDTDVLEGFEHSPLLGFTITTPATGDQPELREPFVACRRSRTQYDLLPAAQDAPAVPACPAPEVRATLGPAYIENGGIDIPEGSVHLGLRPFDHHPGQSASFPYRAKKRNPTKAELAENDKVVVIGAAGGEVVMDTGDYYPDFGIGPDVPARYEYSPPLDGSKQEYFADRVARGVPVCHYAPGIICIVVIPKAQYPQPRNAWPWPPPYTSPRPLDPMPDVLGYTYSANGADQAAYDAWVAANNAARNVGTEPTTPGPIPQSRYLALCDIRTGELLAVSTKPIYTGTARQDASTNKLHRRASVSLSCVQQGTTDPDTGLVKTHAILMISVREPPRRNFNDPIETATSVSVTGDFGETIRKVVSNTHGIAVHYLGTPFSQAEIGVSSGIRGTQGKPAAP